jgi:hypothetical protein
VAVKRIVEERPKPPTFVRRDYPADLELIVLRTLEKKPEDRYQSATELHEDLQNFLAHSSAHLRNNFQMADYVAKIFSEEADALVSDSGRRQAQAFFEGSDNADADLADLDFDVQQSEGPGAALARSLRASALGVWAEVGTAGTPAQAATAAESQVNPSTRDAGDVAESAAEPLFSESASELEKAAKAQISPKVEPKPGLESAKVAAPVTPAAKTPQDVVPDRVPVPRRWNGAVVAGIVLATILAAGLLWWLSGS